MKWLYVIDNVVSGKQYIGVTIDPERRWRHHTGENTHCIALRDAMDKYGRDNFKFTLLCSGEDDYIDELEVKAIQRYNTQVPNGYNLTLGGEGTMYYKWDDDWNKLLGTMTDRDLSKQLNIPHMTIGSRRRALDIPTYFEQTRVDWEDYKHLFNVVSDEEIGNMVGLGRSCVQKARISMGFGATLKRDKIYEVSAHMVPMLSDPSVSQADVAEKFGLGINTVREWRLSNNIRRFSGLGKGRRIELTVEMEADFLDQKYTNKELADKHTISTSFVSTKRREMGFTRKVFSWSEGNLARLWCDSLDKDLAIELGTYEDNVRSKRREVGVPPQERKKYPQIYIDPILSEILTTKENMEVLSKKLKVPAYMLRHVKRKYK